MAAAKELQEEVICSICLDFFRAPVMLDCGHNFCQACISSYWAGAAARACPQCRDSLPSGVLRPNRPLANIAEGLRRLGPAWGDEEPVQSELERLRREKGEVEKQERKERWMCEDRLEKVKVEKRKIELEFKQLRQYLEEQERLLLSRLGELEEQIATRLKENAAKFSTQLIYLGSLIQEKERQLPGHQSLQDAGDVLSRHDGEKPQPKEEMNHELKKEPGACSENVPALEETTRTPQDALTSDTGEGVEESWEQYIKVNITLNADTAQPRLIISADRRSVMLGATKQRQLHRPERFDPWPCVLGCEGFDSGRWCWEVEVVYGSCWAMGVALESVTRKGPTDMSPEGGIWAVGRYKDRFLALTSPSPSPVLQSTVPRRFRICLDRAGRQVMFVDVDSDATIFTFPQAMFGRERIHPWFWVGHETQLKMCL